MPGQKSTPPDEPETTGRFWTWDIKALIVVNIVFLVAIAVGLVLVFKALSPMIETYTNNLDLLK